MKKILLFALIALLSGSCTNEVDNDKETVTKSTLNLSFYASTPDNMAYDNDHTFESIAIYIYNSGGTQPTNVLLQPSFSQTDVTIWERSFSVTPGNITVYSIGNYLNKTFKKSDGTPITLTETLTQAELEDMIVETSTPSPSHTLLMIGKQSVVVSDVEKQKEATIEMRRLSARVDVHIYKGTNLAASNVLLESVTLHNQVFNSEVKFDYLLGNAQMITPTIYNNEVKVNSVQLLPYQAGVSSIPTDAEAHFYSYQNLITVATPLPITTPYLEIKVTSNNIPSTYHGYLTDQNQLLNKYSLIQNQIYKIIAILDIDSKMTLEMNVLPWDKKEIDYGRPIVPSDFSFGAWGTSWGGLNGKTMNTNIGGLEDAVFNFELKAPYGAQWCATLTNGLDFDFTSTTTGTATTCVSKGFTNTGSPALIAVRAAKRWVGVTRDTELYITVEGKEIVINPVIGSARKYDGTDTRIIIRQVASYN